MSKAQKEKLQREFNAWTDRWLKGVKHLKVDGSWGKQSRERAMGIQYYLGYGKKRDGELTEEFARRRRHPRDPRYSTPLMLATGAARRRRQRKRRKRPCTRHPQPEAVDRRRRGRRGVG